MGKRTKYAQVGIGGRARFFYEAIAGTYSARSELVGFCDVNQTRMDYANRIICQQYAAEPVPTYTADQFDTMIEEQNPDVVIVTSIDRTHHRYIIRAMERGCDVITEKPMTVDAGKCRAILDAIDRTGRELRVTFNYRYAPHSTKVRELVANDTIGQVFSVHFEWLLDTSHGADYFRRWHRDKRNSGGLLVHKSTHHFDLVNFWLNTEPETVFAMGDLMFYGRANAEERGETKFYARAHGSAHAQDDPFALKLEDNPQLREMYLEAEVDDGYFRDQSVFGDGISIEDAMAVMVRYKNQAFMTYSLNAYMPWEGFRVALNGSRGRMQLSVVESTYVNSGGDKNMEGALKNKSIAVFPMFGEPYEVDVPVEEGGHGGGDPVLLEDLFGTPGPDPFARAAGHRAGAASILTGIAANRSMAQGQPVQIRDLLKG